MTSSYKIIFDDCEVFKNNYFSDEVKQDLIGIIRELYYTPD